MKANATPRPANGVVVHTASPTEISPDMTGRPEPSSWPR